MGNQIVLQQGKLRDLRKNLAAGDRQVMIGMLTQLPKANQIYIISSDNVYQMNPLVKKHVTVTVDDPITAGEIVAICIVGVGLAVLIVASFVYSCRKKN